MANPIKDRTIQFVKYKGIKMREFEQKCDLSSGYITSMRKGMGPEKLNNVLNAYPELNRDWLLYGEGSMLKDSEKTTLGKNNNLYYTYLLPMSAIGGSLVGFDTKGAMASDCEKIISPIADVDFAITIYGDSMYPTFPSGSRVLIKKIDPEVFVIWGSTYVLDTVNGIVIKEVHESSKKGKIICHSLNPSGKYSDFEVNMKDIRGWYRVLACISML